METAGFKQSLLLAALALSALLVSAGTSMANLALPSISKDFSLSFSTVRWVVLGYLMAITVFSLAVGRLADLKGRRNILLLGMILFSTGSLVSFFSLSFSTLIFGRIIQGVGGAALAVIPIAIATDVLPSKKVGRAIGLLATMSAVGTVTGPSIGGFLLGGFGWRSIFAVPTILGIFALFISFIIIQPGKESMNSNQQKNALLDFVKSFYSDPSFRLHLLSNLAIAAVMISTLIVGPFYLTHSLHLDPYHMGLVMSVGPITSILSGTIAGYAVDRFGYGFVLKCGFVQSLIGTIAFIFLPIKFGSIGFALSAVLLSLGYQLFLSANSNSLMQNARTEHRGMASGALNFSRNLGLLCGTYLMGGLFDFFAKNSSAFSTPEQAITNGFQITFAVAAVMIAVLLINQVKHQKKRSTQ